MHGSDTHKNQFDFLFLGIGAANSLVLIKLFEAGLLNGKRLAYIDPKPYSEGTYSNDKTFCFWATESELELMGIGHLVSASWGNLEVSGSKTPISPYRYYHIRSEDLFRFTGEVLERLNITRISDSVKSIDLDSYPHMVECEAGEAFGAKEIFDSRPPEFEKLKEHQTHLNQSFYGWVVETEANIFDQEVFTMMDFNVAQLNTTQFMYVLPFNGKTALIELTRFGIEILKKDEANPILQEYIEQRFGAVKVIHQEQGVIPMSTATLPQNYLGRHLLRTGGRAGRIKPSTGYAFKEMVFDAARIAQNGSKNCFWGFHRKMGHQKGRFAFYDRLLLKVLEKYPNKGAEIFTRLFARIEAPRILRFLEEKTRFTQEISILMSLPKRPFIEAAMVDIKSRMLEGSKRNISVIISVLIGFLYVFGQELAAQVLLLVGLVLVGIPHGALDHVLESRGRKADFSFAFFAKYVGLMGLMFGIWQLYAPMGLVLFLLYSAWHFGESDFKEMGLNGSVFSFSWGVWILSTILFTHVEELNIFLPHFNVPTLQIPEALWGLNQIEWGLIMSGFIIWIFSHANPVYAGLRKVLFVLSIGCFLPLLVAFGLYFVGHHSVNGWGHLRKGLRYSNSDLWKKAWPFSLGAFAIIGGFLMVSDPGVTAYWAQFFVFLSCVSFPHVWEMKRFYQTV